MTSKPSGWIWYSLLWLAPLIFLGLFYFYPLSSIIDISLSRSQSGIFAPFRQVFYSQSFWHILGFTFWQATLSTLLTLALGIPAAYLFSHYNFKGKSFLHALTGIPFLLPTLVVAASFNTLLGPNGWINILLRNIFHLNTPPIHFTNTLTAILIAHVFYNTTIVLRMVGDFWSHLDPHLVQAANMLGANRRQALGKIILPLLSPSILAAALLVFIFDFTSFGVILILGGPRYATLETEIYFQTVSMFNLPVAAVLSLIQIAITLGLSLAFARFSRRLSIPLVLKSRKIVQQNLISIRSKLFTGSLLLIILILLTLPLAGLAIRSFTHFTTNQGDSSLATNLTLDFYRELSVNRRASAFYAPPLTAIGISLGYAFTTTILALLLGFPAAIALSRDVDLPVNRGFDALLMLPLGTSAVTLGLGFIVALDAPPLDLRASWLLVPLAHTLVAFPFVVRNLTPALRSIRPRFRQAAAVLGASPGAILRKIDIPLIGRATLVAGTFAFTISLGEFGATSLIARPEYPTIPVVIYRLITRPGELNYGQALALSTILMVVAGSAMFLIDKLRVGDIGEF